MNHSIAIIALGANLGERRETLNKALAQLENAGFHVLAVSSFYETVPVGYADQPDFLNAVAALEIPAGVSPESVLAQLLATENTLGRERPFPNAPRTCDLDLLFFEDEKRQTESLILPHPRRHERAFVLAPLCELLENAQAQSAAWSLREPWNALRHESADFLATLDASGVRICPEK